jgi:hypothetical protein
MNPTGAAIGAAFGAASNLVSTIAEGVTAPTLSGNVNLALEDS